MSTGNSTVYKYVREHYQISNEHRGAREHQLENPCPRAFQGEQDEGIGMFTISPFVTSL
jgi:hypothetical protein